MRCPHCSSLEDRVLESRMLAGGESVRRRRECLNCTYRFTSYERIEEKQLMVVKNNGRREPFSRKKLERGIRRALEKRHVSQVAIEEMLNDLEDEAALLGTGNNEIISSQIGEMVLRRLYLTDKVAYIRFASVYRNYENVEEFVGEIEKLPGLSGKITKREGK
jgi:transcriptional repressor NrdR